MPCVIKCNEYVSVCCIWNISIVQEIKIKNYDIDISPKEVKFLKRFVDTHPFSDIIHCVFCEAVCCLTWLPHKISILKIISSYFLDKRKTMFCIYEWAHGSNINHNFIKYKYFFLMFCNMQIKQNLIWHI